MLMDEDDMQMIVLVNIEEGGICACETDKDFLWGFI